MKKDEFELIQSEIKEMMKGYKKDYELDEVCKTLYENRLFILDLFCKTFLVSQTPKSPEELRNLFDMCELKETRNKDMSSTYQIKFKDKFQPKFCKSCKILI